LILTLTSSYCPYISDTKRWEDYQINQGKTPVEAKAYINRYGNEYFPISVTQHIQLLNEVGFDTVEVLWVSYMQSGFFAIKR